MNWCEAAETDEECAGSLSIQDLPELPRRGAAFWSEPFMGVCVVGVPRRSFHGAFFPWFWGRFSWIFMDFRPEGL